MCRIKAIIFSFVQNNHKTLSIPIHMGVQLLKPEIWGQTASTEMAIWCCSSFSANRPSLTSAHPCAGYHRGIISLPFHHSSGWQERGAKMTHKVMHWIPVHSFLKCVPSKFSRAGTREKSSLDTGETCLFWSCLRSECTLTQVPGEYYISAFHTAVHYLLTFAAVCKEASFSFCIFFKSFNKQ